MVSLETMVPPVFGKGIRWYVLLTPSNFMLWRARADFNGDPFRSAIFAFNTLMCTALCQSIRAKQQVIKHTFVHTQQPVLSKLHYAHSKHSHPFAHQSYNLVLRIRNFVTYQGRRYVNSNSITAKTTILYGRKSTINKRKQKHCT